jgi:type II secretory pathway component PulF
MTLVMVPSPLSFFLLLLLILFAGIFFYKIMQETWWKARVHERTGWIPVVSA